jgi:hypothetical protein
MSKNLEKLGRSLGLVIAFLVVFEGFVFLRWTFFSGPEPSLHDLQTGLGILIAIWAVSKLAGWFERREARDKEVAARIRAIDARVEGLYKWGALCHSGDDGKDNDDWEWELDDETKAEIAECI